MLTQLATVKSRLAIPDTDTQYDALLTNAIKAVSARFDKETNRTLARNTHTPQSRPSSAATPALRFNASHATPPGQQITAS